jgi:hypothetical protein
MGITPRKIGRNEGDREAERSSTLGLFKARRGSDAVWCSKEDVGGRDPEVCE